MSDEVQPDVVVRGVESIKRRGRWLEVELADGRLLAFDPIDVTGCEASAPLPTRDQSLTIYLRGGESVRITNVDPRTLWALIVGATR